MLSTALAGETVTLKASRVGHVLVLNGVLLNGAGPFRMMVDTGNASSLIRPQVARRLEVRPAYTVEHEAGGHTRREPVALLDQVTTGGLTEHSVEAMIGDVALDGVDGVLGQSWLVRHNYLLDYRNGRVEIDGPPPAAAANMALHSEDGRPLVDAMVDGRRANLVVDSGAPAVVLFECAARLQRGVVLVTNGTAVEATEALARIALTGDRERQMRAVCIDSGRRQAGLLPASAFSGVFVSNREGFVSLTR
jgi:predicted aspartyl protease